MNIEVNFSSIKKFLSTFFKYSKAFIYIGIFFFCLAIFQTVTAPKLYHIQVDLTKNDYESAPTQTDNSISSLAKIVGGSSGSGQFFQVIRRIHSMQVASMMADAGYMDTFFGGSYNSKQKIYQRNIKFSEKMGAAILGYDIEESLSVKDLRSFLRSKVKISISRDQTEIFVSTYDTDPIRGKKLLDDLIKFTDQSFRLERLKYTLNQKDHFSDVLSKSNTIALREQYINKLIQIESRLASLQSNLPYVVKYVDEIIASDLPVTPNVTRIFIINFIYAIFLYSLFALYSIYSKKIIEAWKKA